MQTTQSTDIYAELDTEEERQAKYKELQAVYEQKSREWEESVCENYNKILDAIKKDKTEEERHFEKTVFAVSAGAFGVSFAFIDKVIPLENAVFPRMLATAWVFFGLCLILRIVNHFCCMLLHTKRYDEENRNARLVLEKKKPEKTRHKMLRRTAIIADAVSALATGGGIVCLVIFVFLNFSS